LNHTFKMVSIYIDYTGNIILIPTTRAEKKGVIGGAIADIDIAHQLNTPYTNEELETELMKALAECYSKEADMQSKTTVIEKLLNIKGWEKAVNDKKLVDLTWTEEGGYEVTPTRKEHKPKRGYTYLSTQAIKLGKQVAPGGLAKAVATAIEISTN
jgi:hypothetical protein